MNEIRKCLTEILRREEQMPKVALIDEAYARLSATQSEIKAEWSMMKKEGLVYCVIDMPGWVGIF